MTSKQIVPPHWREPDFVCWIVDPADLAAAMEEHLRNAWGLCARDFLTVDFDGEYPEVCLARLDADILSEADLVRLGEAGLDPDDSYQLFQQLIEELWGSEASFVGDGKDVEIYVPFGVYRRGALTEGGENDAFQARVRAGR
ncbi:MAG: hypothetical protein ACPLRW_05595 [Moorellales bacterium]